MNYKKIFWGVIFIALGLALVLRNLGVVYFTWHALWHMWPLILILWGISVLPVRDLWKLLISFGAIGLTILFFSLSPQRYHDNDWCWNWSRHSHDEDTEYNSKPGQVLTERYDSTINTAVVTVDLAAGSFNIRQSTADLINFENAGKIGNYSMEVQRKSDSAIINLNMHSKKHIDLDEDNGGKVDIKLNTNPLWDFTMDVGAASLDMDLSEFKIKNLTLNGGATSATIKLGALQKETHLSLETGASSIKVQIPQSAGCEVITSTFLSSRNLKGFTKTGNTYRTENFGSSPQKIYINMDAAVSSIDVVRY
ncbi:MAG: DUF5668 domain-containing protein [Bacteroidetes bacterium]|nr:DUF5668 domain-containing protein [Bacteroidota bacterium]